MMGCIDDILSHFVHSCTHAYQRNISTMAMENFASMPVGVSIKSKTAVIFASETLADFKLQ